MVKWSFVIPNFNGASVIESCLNSALSVSDETATSGEIIVVDDCSNDTSVEIIEKFDGRVKIIRHDINRGFSSACNTGINAADGEIIILINNDVQVRKGLIENAIRHFDDEKLFAVSFKAIDENGNERIGRTIPKFRKGFLKGIPCESAGLNEEKPVETFFASGGGRGI